ncbi:glycoside hydrolase family 18 protein [Candidatus Dependentiae bacterium]|nr:glycoside hydrolase family 18 protein [Candidatus Dependentiae bacterium]
MRFSLIAVSFLVSILFLIHTALPKSFVPRKKIKQDKEVVAAYFAGWDTCSKNPYCVEDMDQIAPKLTHVIYAFAKPNPVDGTCELPAPVSDVGAMESGSNQLGGNFAELLRFKKRFPHIKILLSIAGGADSKYVSEIVKKGYMKKFITSCVSLLDRYEYFFVDSKTDKKRSVVYHYEGLFDGIDLDWEWANNIVPEKEVQVFADMIVLLRKLLQDRELKTQKKQILTVALQVSAAVYRALPLEKIVSYVDWFHVMTYNFFGSFSFEIGFNAPLSNPSSVYSIENAIDGLLALDLPAHKLVLGIPLYGYAFDKTVGGIGASFKKTSRTRALSYAKIKELYLNNPGCNYSWHEKSSVPYLYCPDDSIFVSFDDQRSVQEKVKFARKKNLRGVMLWRLASDDDEHTLVHSL